MPKLSTKEKADLYDQLRKMSTYKEPSWGYHSGSHHIVIRTNSEEDTPRNFTTALKQSLKEGGPWYAKS